MLRFGRVLTGIVECWGTLEVLEASKTGLLVGFLVNIMAWVVQNFRGAGWIDSSHHKVIIMAETDLAQRGQVAPSLAGESLMFYARSYPG